MATQPQGDIFSQLAAGQAPQAAQPKTSAAPSGDIFDTIASSGNSKQATTPSIPNRAEPEPTGFLAGTIRGLHNLIKMPGQLYDAVTSPAQSEEERMISENGVDTISGHLPGALALPIYRLVGKPMQDAQDKADQYNQLAATEQNPKIKKQLQDAAGVYGSVGAHLPLVGPLASQLAERAAYGSQGPTTLDSTGGGGFENKNADLSGALGETTAYVAAPSVIKGAGEVAGDVAGKTADVVKNSDVVQGAKVAQAPAQAALRSGAQASAADAGVAATDATGSIRSLMDDPIEALSKNERAAYDKINEASETDLKSLYDREAELQDALDDPTQIAQKSALQTELKTTQSAIQQGEDLATSKGVDPATLDKAKAMTQQRYAMENVNSKLFNNEAVVKGNVEHGAPETINVDSAIRQVENLDKPSRFAPRGTPSRLQQAFGEDGAKALKQGLYDAQKAGQTALSKQSMAKWGLGLGLAGIGLGKVAHLASVLTRD